VCRSTKPKYSFKDAYPLSTCHVALGGNHGMQVSHSLLCWDFYQLSLGRCNALESKGFWWSPNVGRDRSPQELFV
jgi:hypothetical protein